MLQLQMLAGEVMHSVFEKLEDSLRHELFEAKGLIAGMVRV